MMRFRNGHLTTAVLILGMLRATITAQEEGKLAVCCTTSDLAALTEAVGGDQVTITTFAKAPEDPHFVEAKPSFVKALSEADLFIVVGLELEVGWAPVLLQNCRNKAVLPGNEGYLDASTAIQPLGIPTGAVDRSMGDVHLRGNPHYLLDPLEGLKVARLIRDRLTAKRPSQGDYFRQRTEAFEGRVGLALVGEKLALKYDFRKLALLHERGKLTSFLKEQGDDSALGGWLGRLASHFGARVVAEHDLWPYFARRFGIEVDAFLEPKPGVPPTTKHLGEVVSRMKADGTRVILSVPYFDPKHAALVAKACGARVAAMSHQTGARSPGEDYLTFVGRNVDALLAAIDG